MNDIIELMKEFNEALKTVDQKLIEAGSAMAELLKLESSVDNLTKK